MAQNKNITNFVKRAKDKKYYIEKLIGRCQSKNRKRKDKL